MTIKFIQINLNHCQQAQDLLSQIVYESGAEVAIISEQYKNIQNSVWVRDLSGKAAIWACGSKAIEETSGHLEDGYVYAKIGGVYVYSCYARPSATIEEFKLMLDRLVRDSERHNPKIIAGDFNAWAAEWGSRRTNARGRILLEAFSKCDLILTNHGNQPTFIARDTNSIIDLTFMSTALSREAKWEVSDQYTHSDHQAIIFSINSPGKKDSRAKSRITFKGWASKKLDKELFLENLSWNLELKGTVEEKTKQLTTQLSRACDAAMPRRRISQNRQPNYWWNEEISNLRTACLKARRRAQRSRGRSNFETSIHEYQNARRKFQQAIQRSKIKSFKQICLEADTDPWGKAYNVVTSKLRGIKTPQPTCPALLEKIITTLFPKHRTEEYHPREPERYEIISIVTEEEVLQVARGCGDSKTPGPDGIPNNALKLAISTMPKTFAEMFTECLKAGTFPNLWKVQTLVLIPKPNKILGDPSAYRPICLLDTMGKILEKIIYNRLLPIVEEKNALSDNQFGFRKARSTIDAINMVTETAKRAIDGKRAKKKYCAVITLDVKNAFNTANWILILKALIRLGVPEYLTKIISSYFSNRKLCYNTDDGIKTYEVTAGVPQGSVLGPLLWNIMYNDVLTLKIPEEAKIIGFADDIALTVSARYIDEVELIANESTKIISEWMKSVGLALAEHKTEVVLIARRKKRGNIKIRVGKHEVTSQPDLKYLGVRIDARLNFKSHISYACQKASNVRMAIERMMPNVGGPRQSKRRIIMTVVSSQILYGAPIWADALKEKTTRRSLLSVYRLCGLRVCSAFRTTSGDAINVLSGMIPIDILVDESSRIYNSKKRGEQNAQNIEREESLRTWQRRWEASQNGRWTFRLVPNIKKWINRKHGELNYHLTQFMSGHGGYRSYLFRFGLDDSPFCPHCRNIKEDPEHVIFYCPRFDEERRKLEQTIETQLCTENFVDTLLSSKENWENVCKSIKSIHVILRIEEEERRRALQSAILEAV